MALHVIENCGSNFSLDIPGALTALDCRAHLDNRNRQNGEPVFDR
jgi:hypothetical protein